MHIFVCLDDRNGMSFGGRRQSMDRAVRKDILELAAGKPLRMSAYSAGQFETGEIMADDLFLHHAKAGDLCFLENLDITPYWERIDCITVYRWNRLYPADLYFLKPAGWKCVEQTTFSGHSHETITRETYILWDEPKEN